MSPILSQNPANRDRRRLLLDLETSRESVTLLEREMEALGLIIKKQALTIRRLQGELDLERGRGQVEALAAGPAPVAELSITDGGDRT